MQTKPEEINSGFLCFHHSYDRKVFCSHLQPNLFLPQHGDSFLPASMETFIVWIVYYPRQGQSRNEERDEHTRPQPLTPPPPKSCSHSSWDHTLWKYNTPAATIAGCLNMSSFLHSVFSSNWRWLTMLTTRSAHNDVTDVCRLAENIVRCHVVNHSKMS